MSRSSSTPTYRPIEEPVVMDKISTSASPLSEPNTTDENSIKEKETLRILSDADSDLEISVGSTPEQFQVLKHWEGVVTCVERHSFFAMARLVESAHDLPEDEFEIELDNVAEGDRNLVQEGAVFYLTVGIRYPLGSRPEKVTRLYFRRMPRWSEGDIKRADSAADELWHKLHSGKQDDLLYSTHAKTGSEKP